MPKHQNFKYMSVLDFKTQKHKHRHRRSILFNEYDSSTSSRIQFSTYMARPSMHSLGWCWQTMQTITLNPPCTEHCGLNIPCNLRLANFFLSRPPNYIQYYTSPPPLPTPYLGWLMCLSFHSPLQYINLLSFLRSSSEKRESWGVQNNKEMWIFPSMDWNGTSKITYFYVIFWV